MNRLVQILRTFFRFVTPVIFVVSFILKTYLYPDFSAIQYLYIIVLASMVGYFTNFIAIKMLFHPRKKTVFGRQGLIPRNQEKIAALLGENISDQFFLPEDVSKYLFDQKIIHQLVAKGRLVLREKLEDPEIQQSIRIWLLDRFRKNQTTLQSLLQNLSRKNVAELLQNHVSVEKLVHFVSDKIESGVKDGTIDLEQISNWLGETLHQHSPQIAKVIYEQFEGYMETQSGLKKGAMKLIQWMADFDRDALQDLLYQKFSSKQFRKDIYKTTQSWMNRFIVYLKTEQGSENINSMYHKGMVQFSNWIEEKGIASLLNKIEERLSQPESWKSIENVLFTLLQFLDKESQYFVKSRTFKKLLHQGTMHLLSQMNVSKMVRERIQHFDTDQLERLIIKTSEEQLGMIEVLGGFLGAFTGIAIFNPLLFAIVFSGLILILGVEWILSRVLNKRLTSRRSN